MVASASVRISAQDRREQILDVAKTLFARQGFEGTTTREIAERARVNEAIIYRHFPTKEDLYWAIIERKIQTSGRLAMMQEVLASGGSDLEIFRTIAERILRRGKPEAEITRLLLFTALERHELSHGFFRKHVAGQFALLAGYIRRRIAAGAFRAVDPVLAARSFLGMLIYHYQVEELFGIGEKRNRYDPDEAAHCFAEIWLSGMVTRTPAARRQNGRRRNGSANGKAARVRKTVESAKVPA